MILAVLGVGLGKHHQLDVVGVAPQVIEALHQVVDFVFGQGQAQLGVGLFQSRSATTEYVHGGQRFGFGMAEQRTGLFQLGQHQLGHAVVQYGRDLGSLLVAQLARHVVGDAALQALDLGQAAVIGDIGGLARPRRNGAETRHHEEQAASGLLYRYAWTVLEQARQHRLLFAGQHASNLGKMGELGIQPANSGDLFGQLRK